MRIVHPGVMQIARYSGEIVSRLEDDSIFQVTQERCGAGRPEPTASPAGICGDAGILTGMYPIRWYQDQYTPWEGMARGPHLPCRAEHTPAYPGKEGKNSPEPAMQKNRPPEGPDK